MGTTMLPPCDGNLITRSNYYLHPHDGAAVHKRRAIQLVYFKRRMATSETHELQEWEISNQKRYSNVVYGPSQNKNESMLEKKTL